MQKTLYFSVAFTFLVIVFLGATRAVSAQSKPSERSKAAPQIFFDDFSYSNSRKMVSHGWIIRTADGWPGIPGAKWLTQNVSLLPDPETQGNRFLRMTSSTDGTAANTTQTQICHQRKYLEGTYAARVRFTDQPAS